jgi:hypothetical protein
MCYFELNEKYQSGFELDLRFFPVGYTKAENMISVPDKMKIVFTQTKEIGTFGSTANRNMLTLSDHFLETNIQLRCIAAY